MNESELTHFVKLAKRSESVDEFMDKAQQIKDVSQQMQDWFADKYGAGTMLSVEKASADFMEDVENGKYERITNPYLYRRSEKRF